VEDFTITKEKIHDGVKFITKGQIKPFSAAILQNTLEEAIDYGHVNIVLNMLWVKYISSIGVRVILQVYKKAENAGSKFRIELPSENVKNVLGMAALDELLMK